jgi:hypothetical protein
MVNLNDYEFEDFDYRYDYSLIQIFLHQQGDSVYRTLIELNVFNLDSDHDIDLFFSSIEESCDKIVEDFDIDAFLNDNLHIMQYYEDEKYNNSINIEQITPASFDEIIKFYFEFPKRPSMQYLLKYLEPANLNMSKISTEVIPPSSYQQVNRLNELEKKFRDNLKGDADDFKHLGDFDIFRSNNMSVADIRQVPDIFQAKKYKDFYISLLESFFI